MSCVKIETFVLGSLFLTVLMVSVDVKQHCEEVAETLRAQELCESRGGLPGLQVLIVLMVSVDVKQH